MQDQLGDKDGRRLISKKEKRLQANLFPIAEKIGQFILETASQQGKKKRGEVRKHVRWKKNCRKVSLLTFSAKEPPSIRGDIEERIGKDIEGPDPFFRTRST